MQMYIRNNLTQVCLSLDFDPHNLVQPNYLHDSQEWAVSLKSLLQVANNRLYDIIERHRDVDAQFIDLIQPLAASLLKSMFHVVERLIDFIRN